jgi:hypothetical protein
MALRRGFGLKFEVHFAESLRTFDWSSVRNAGHIETVTYKIQSNELVIKHRQTTSTVSKLKRAALLKAVQKKSPNLCLRLLADHHFAAGPISTKYLSSCSSDLCCLFHLSLLSTVRLLLQLAWGLCF